MDGIVIYIYYKLLARGALTEVLLSHNGHSGIPWQRD